jgi:hypothetical protein
MWGNSRDFAMTAHEIIQNLLQAKLELQNETFLEQFWFMDGGRVVATLGTKDGAVCGPVLGYQIQKDETVEIGNPSESLFYKWKNLQLSENELIVTCDGMTKRFAITRPPKKERWLP